MSATHLAIEASDMAPGARRVEVHLPFPPSTNRIWRHRKAGRLKVSLSPQYVAWKRAANNLAIAFHQLRGVRPIRGHFLAEIVLSESRRTPYSDGDNRIKVLLDWAQTVELIPNDALCDGGTWRWGLAPHGCRLILREVA